MIFEKEILLASCYIMVILAIEQDTSQTRNQYKMPNSILYSNFRIRSLVPRALVKHLKLDVTVVAPEVVAEKFSADFPLKKLPAFIDSKGFKLTESMAINNYLINLSDNEKEKRLLLGPVDDFKMQAAIIRWQSLANSDLLIEGVKAFCQLRGDIPFNKNTFDEASAKVKAITDLYEARLKEYTYLASENISLADLVSAASFTRLFQYMFGAEWRAANPAITRWYTTVISSTILKDEFTDFKFIETQVLPPKIQKRRLSIRRLLNQLKLILKKPAPKKKAKHPSKSLIKMKYNHPLEALPRPTFVLDNWKRKYSNEDTRSVALPWFWEHYNPKEYSIWKVEYKYNDELTMTFMSNNLVGGFINRLTGSIKYIFGCLVVYGENNANGIVGAVMIRGQEFEPAFNVAPEWESYSFTKVDTTNEEQKEFVNNMWAWDKPYEGKEIADGKVLK